MKQALPFIQRGVREGLTATAALSQYRDGGGAIRDSSWYQVYRLTFAQEGVRENVKRIPETYIVTDQMFEPVPYDYREKYVMKMKVSGYSTELDQRIHKWVTVESDHLLTKSEWRSYAQLAVTDTIGSPDFTVDRVDQWTPQKRIN
jgi:hypothetical protein